MEKKITVGILEHKEGNTLTCINDKESLPYYTYSLLSGKQYLLSLGHQVRITLLIKCYETKIIVVNHHRNLCVEISDLWEYVSDKLYITIRIS
jgi:hypothetical protein